MLQPAKLYEQVAPNGYLPRATTAGGASYRLPGPRVRFGESPKSQVEAPNIGQHTEDILMELCEPWYGTRTLRSQGALG